MQCRNGKKAIYAQAARIGIGIGDTECCRRAAHVLGFLIEMGLEQIRQFLLKLGIDHAGDEDRVWPRQGGPVAAQCDFERGVFVSEYAAHRAPRRKM